MVMSAGALGLSASYILMATTVNPLVSAAVLIGGGLLVGLTVVPIAQVIVVQISPSQRIGLGFGLLGLGEVYWRCCWDQLRHVSVLKSSAGRRAE